MAKKSEERESVLGNLLDDMVAMYDRRGVRNRSSTHQRYLAGVKRCAEALRAIIRHGTLDDCLSAVQGTLLHDLEYLARTDAQKKTLLQHSKNFTDALHNLDAIRARPDEYRRQAEGYIDDYKIGGTLPKDGMHGALRSYMGHLKSRDSQYLTPEEADFLEAQKELVAEITLRYTAIQTTLFA